MAGKAPHTWRVVCGGAKKREGKLEKQNNIGMSASPSIAARNMKFIVL